MRISIQPDLFGGAPVIHVEQEKLRKKWSDEARQRRLEREFLARESNNPTMHFKEFIAPIKECLVYLSQPILMQSALPDQFQSSDRRAVALIEETGDELDPDGEPAIPYEAWGSEWVIDSHNLVWSAQGIQTLQNYLFWESMEEMTLTNNEHEKWSVLKWIFRPAISKEFVWDKKLGSSRCFTTHERDYTFSFHNCAMSACMDADIVRDGFRRNLPAELIKAVLRVVEA